MSSVLAVNDVDTYSDDMFWISRLLPYFKTLIHIQSASSFVGINAKTFSVETSVLMF